MGKLIFSGTALLVAGGFLLMACCVFACAGGLIFGLAGSYENDAKEIEELAEFSAGSLHDKVYATGTISGSEAIASDPLLGDISQYELVGYQVDRWDVTRSSSGSSSSRSRRTNYNGSWEDVSSAFGPFALDDGKINVTPNDSVTIDGDVHEYLLPGSGGNGLSDTYNGQTVKDGTLRLQGFQNGDLITVMGIRREGEVLNAEKMYGGTRAEWVEDLKGQAEDSRSVGYILAVCGACFLVPGLGLAAASIYGRRMFKSSDTPSVNPTTAPYGAFGSGAASFGQSPFGQSAPPSASSPFGSPNQPMPFGSSGQSSPFDQSGTATPFGAPTPPAAPPASNIPSGSFWSDSGQSAPSSFEPPADAPSPFDPPKDASDSPFDPPKQ